MTYPQAIVITAALIAAAIFVTNDVPTAQAQITGPWQMAVVPTEKTMAWRINTTTGQMQQCRALSTPVCSNMPKP